MMKKVLARYLCLSCTVLIPYSAYSAEGLTPMQPGATTGAHTGALPPVGTWLTLNSTFESGVVKNGEGHNAKIAGGKNKLSNTGLALSAIWVPGWEVLGARYGAMIVQPYKFVKVENTGAAGTDHTNGFVGTGITPLSLSWDMTNHFHLGAGMTVYLPNGKTAYTTNPTTGKKQTAGDNIAWGYWSFEPNIAVSYLTDDWGLTLNNIFDFNRRNSETGYRSGNTYYLDVTATRKATQNFTYGVIGNWTKQVSDDKLDGERVSGVEDIYSQGKRVEHLKAGPLLSYSFNTVTITGRILFNLHTENDAGMSFYHLGFSMPL